MKSKSNKIKLSFFMLCLLCLPFMNLYAEGDTNRSAENQPWSIRMAESIMIRHPNGYGNWDYVSGTVLRGFEELWRRTEDDRYFDYIKKTVDRVVNSDGSIDDYNLSSYNIDEINEGRMLLFLYKETGEEKYRKAAALLRSQLATHPRTSEGGFWHKQRYPHKMWLDGLYMGSPFLSEYGKLFNKPEDFDDVVNQLKLMEKHARDPITGLLYHCWDESRTQEWADSLTGCSPSFWGRAIGWYAMAVVDVLDFLPEEHAGRDSVIAILQRLTEAVSNFQNDSTGVWWQVVDQGGEKGITLNLLFPVCSPIQSPRASDLDMLINHTGRLLKRLTRASFRNLSPRITMGRSILTKHVLLQVLDMDAMARMIIMSMEPEFEVTMVKVWAHLSRRV